MKCPSCGDVWDYKGKKLKYIEAKKMVYITCPVCRKNIRIEPEGNRKKK